MNHIQVHPSACVLCRLCEISCPTKAITVDKAASLWSINHDKCIQCRQCIQVCPRDALHMSSSDIQTFEIPAQKPTKRLAKKHKVIK